MRQGAAFFVGVAALAASCLTVASAAAAFDPTDPADALTDPAGAGLAAIDGFVPSTNLSTTDSDGGGAPDAWEIANGLDPGDSTDEGEDADGDQWTNLFEYLHGTDPLHSDTDDDGIPDAVDPHPNYPDCDWTCGTWGTPPPAAPTLWAPGGEPAHPLGSTTPGQGTRWPAERHGPTDSDGDGIEG